jgi:hypothetical protein
MTMSTQVKENIRQASLQLREGLAFASRTEHPAIIGMLSDIIMRLESFSEMEEAMNKIGDHYNRTV